MERQRTAAPAPRCTFSDLPSPVAAHIFSLLSNNDRLPVLDVCTAWHAIIDAGGPALWPTAELSYFQHKDAGRATGRVVRRACPGPRPDSLGEAAALSPRLRSLFVYADGGQPEMILCVLAVVPAVSLVRLRFKGRCPSLLPVVLQRFRQLQRVELTGDASRVSWERPGGTWLAGMVCSMELAPVTVVGGSIISDHLCLSPDRAARLGAALSQLTRLGIEVHWSDEERSVPALCAALPSLRALSLCARGVGNAEQAASVVNLLVSLPQHVAIDLTVTRAINARYAIRYTETYWNVFVQLPAGLATVRGLTTLLLDAGIGLSPDWLQLSSLNALTLHNGHLERIAPMKNPGTSLTQLQLHMSSGDVAPALASLTSLQLLRLESGGDTSCSLPASLTALTGLTCLALRGFNLPTVPAPVPDMTSLCKLVMEPAPDQLPAGRYLDGLQELYGYRYMYSHPADLPPSLAMATRLERLELSVPDNNNMSSIASLLAALPALRAVTLLSLRDHYTGFKSHLRALRPDLAVTHSHYY
ncbi:hypothetical protein ACK3TF_003814 [Chlorella vulgaris]